MKSVSFLIHKFFSRSSLVYQISSNKIGLSQYWPYGLKKKTNLVKKKCFCLQGNDDDDDDTPEIGFNFTVDATSVFNDDSQSQPLQTSLPALDTTSLTGDKLLSQPYKVF